MLDLLELELTTVVNCLAWVLGSELTLDFMMSKQLVHLTAETFLLPFCFYLHL